MSTTFRINGAVWLLSFDGPWLPMDTSRTRWPPDSFVQLHTPAPLPGGHYFDPYSTGQDEAGICPIHGAKMSRIDTETIEPGRYSRATECGWFCCPVEGCPCPRWRVPSARQLALRAMNARRSERLSIFVPSWMEKHLRPEEAERLAELCHPGAKNPYP